MYTDDLIDVYILAIGFNDAINKGVQLSFRDPVFVSFAYIHSGVGLLDHNVLLFLMF